MRIQAGPFLVFSDFDSGNILTAECVQTRRSTDSITAGTGLGVHDYELNVCTKPDCFGTPHENGNRTWFHFGIQMREGEERRAGAILKLNILNLNKQVKLFTQGMQPVFRYLPQKPTWERVRDKLLINEKEEHVCSISFNQRLPEDPNSVLFVAFTYPYSYTELTEWLDDLDTVFAQTKLEGFPFHVNCKLSPSASKAELLMLKSAQTTKNQIYYHRECLIYSLEGRRVELITITSCEGMSEDREERLAGLFPLEAEERPHKFPSKKVIFLSARVHPGETPSSFVLNGVYKFLLEPTDPRALLLRKLFVFKICPMLNPDGVALGHYRSDSRGVNLNRVYLQPSRQLHPSIYACRKLLLYYHCGVDLPDDNITPEDPVQPAKSCTSGHDHDQSTSKLHSRSSSSRRKWKKSDVPTRSASTSLTRREGRRSRSRKPSGSGGRSKEMSPQFKPEISSATCSQGHGLKSWPQEDNSESTFETCDEDSLVYVSKPFSAPTVPFEPTPSVANRLFSDCDLQPRRAHSLTSPAPSPSISPRSPRKRKEKTISGKRSKVSRSHLNSVSSISSSSSGLFCYIDMHGHATKRGIFMYGNHFEDSSVQAECMLLPKLMSMNCPNFEFSACNFTERLMNMRDRRDGASREGSGRVAIFKLTGLIRSYTLECNYNTGRMVNNVLNRGSLLGIPDKCSKYILRPPKFTPEVFEDAGRALGESLLDLTNRNPWSRIGFTEFKSVDGMRKWLLKRIQASREVESPECIMKRNSAAGPTLRRKDSLNTFQLLQAVVKPSSSKSLKKPSSSSKVALAETSKTKSSKNTKKEKEPREKINFEPFPSKSSKQSTRSNLLKVFKVKRKSKSSTRESKSTPK